MFNRAIKVGKELGAKEKSASWAEVSTSVVCSEVLHTCRGPTDLPLSTRAAKPKWELVS